MPRKPKAAVSKAVVLPLESISLSKLVLSDSNVRATVDDSRIFDLADDIARRRVMQSLTVRASGDDLFEVIAGGRRLRAMQKLLTDKRISDAFPVPCTIMSTGLAEEDSLAENAYREALAPYDEFVAFAGLVEKGLSLTDVTARFRVTTSYVRQRLKLSRVAPDILQAYRDGRLDLIEVEVFTIADDHASQTAAFQSLGEYVTAWAIRDALRKSEVGLEDARLRFVGLEAYESAGGRMQEDMFSRDEGPAGRLQTPAKFGRAASFLNWGRASSLWPAVSSGPL